MQARCRTLLGGDTDVTQVAAAWGKEGLPDRLTWLDLWLASGVRGYLPEVPTWSRSQLDLRTCQACAPHVEHKRRLQHGGSTPPSKHNSLARPCSASWPSNPGWSLYCMLGARKGAAREMVFERGISATVETGW